MSKQTKPQMAVAPVNEIIQRGDFAMLPGCDPKPVTELTGEWVGKSLHGLRAVYVYDHPCHTMVILRPEPEPEWFDLTPHDGHVLRKYIDEINHGAVYVEVNASEGVTIGASKATYGGKKFRCLLKDAPIPEPKPAKLREVLLYWYDGNVVGRYADCQPTDQSFVPLILRDGKVFIKTETREVVR